MKSLVEQFTKHSESVLLKKVWWNRSRNFNNGCIISNYTRFATNRESRKITYSDFINESNITLFSFIFIDWKDRLNKNFGIEID